MDMPLAFCLAIAAVMGATGQPMAPEQAPSAAPPAMEPGRPGPGPGMRQMTPMPPMAPRSPMGRGRQMPGGRWWTNPEMVQKLGLTADQKQKIDSIFQQSRLKLIDLNAALQKEEAILEPLLEAERPDEAKVVAQIDRVAQARGELEKSNARMLLGFRGVLTQEQWKKLQADRPQGPPPPAGPPAVTPVPPVPPVPPRAPRP